MDEIKQHLKRTKEASYSLGSLSEMKRNAVLYSLSEAIKKSSDLILKENAKDLARMSSEDPRYDRLLLTEERLHAMAEDVLKVVHLSSPLHKILEDKKMPNGLHLQKITVPLGVIGVIYEARPNVSIDVFTLCFKAGNACVLKGGKEASQSNQALGDVIKNVLIEHHLNPEILYMMTPEREAVQVLLNAVGLVDVCIPRGSQALIEFVRNHSKIPVIETGAGIVHAYFDVSGDVFKGRAVIDNAKTRRVSVCNALDTLIIHQERLKDLRILLEPLKIKNVEIFADALSHQVLEGWYPEVLLHLACPKDFGREFLSHKMSLKTVGSSSEAIKHIMSHTSHHSEAIIAEDPDTISYFLEAVDAAVIYVNASTGFTDGGEFGLGSEIGISTQKLHARGPMGLEALTSYKWLAFGNGTVRT